MMASASCVLRSVLWSTTISSKCLNEFARTLSTARLSFSGRFRVQISTDSEGMLVVLSSGAIDLTSWLRNGTACIIGLVTKLWVGRCFQDLEARVPHLINVTAAPIQHVL